MFIYIVILILILSFSVFDFSKIKQKFIGFTFLVTLLILFIGFRGECGTDSLSYIDFFKNQTDVIGNWKNLEPAYLEYGFYYLSVLIKSIYNNIYFYFIIISCLTMYFLFRSLGKFCLYPILGMGVYYSRFLILRDMNQIRQALAITIIIFALRYLYYNRKIAFIVSIVAASFVHYSSISVLPLVFIYNNRQTFSQKIKIILICAVLGFCLGYIFKDMVISIGYTKLLHYINQTNLGLTNPILLYQIFVFFLFCKYENVLATKQKGYYIIQNAYWLSIIILLLTSGFGDIGGRLGTILATCEIYILPSFCKIFRPRIMGYCLVIILISLLFSLNYLRITAEPANWTYF